MWFPLALLSAGFVSLRRIAEKPLTGKIPYFALGFLSQFLSLPLLLILFLVAPAASPLIRDPMLFWLPLVFIWLVLWPIQTYCYYRALLEGNIAEVVPVISLVPIFIVAISAVFTGEVPSVLGFLGILLTVLGILLLNSQSLRSISRLKQNIPFLLMILYSLSSALGATLDKIALSVSSPEWYALVNFTGASIVLFLIALRKKGAGIPVLWKLKGSLLLVGTLQAMVYSSYVLALQTGVTSYVFAIRNLNVIISAILGILIFREKVKKHMSIAFVCIAAGIIILGFWG